MRNKLLFCILFSLRLFGNEEKESFVDNIKNIIQPSGYVILAAMAASGYFALKVRAWWYGEKNGATGSHDVMALQRISGIEGFQTGQTSGYFQASAQHIGTQMALQQEKLTECGRQVGMLNHRFDEYSTSAAATSKDILQTIRALEQSLSHSINGISIKMNALETRLAVCEVRLESAIKELQSAIKELKWGRAFTKGPGITQVEAAARRAS